MYYYSTNTNSFYPSALETVYKKAGTWPADAVQVSIDVFNEFSDTAPEGKKRASGADGLPCWVDDVIES